MKVTLKNPATGLKVEMPINGSFYFFGVFFGLGLPLFFHRLYKWGLAFLIIWAMIMATLIFFGEDSDILSMLSLVYLSLTIFMGIKGPKITLMHYLKNGWIFADPDSEETKRAIFRFGITG